MTHTFGFAATVWEYDGPASWFFVSLPTDVADEIADLTDGRTGGFGSVRVHVRRRGQPLVDVVVPVQAERPRTSSR